MIFASVGSMLPFDRLIRAVDEWAAQNSDQPVFLQIGDGAYKPRHAPWARIVPHGEYRQRLAECSLFVAHVGMGSILQALEARKQMLLMPRQASLREHTTEHQLHTAKKFRETPGLMIVDDDSTLQREMSRLIVTPMTELANIDSFAPDAMTARISSFLRAQAT